MQAGGYTRCHIAFSTPMSSALVVAESRLGDGVVKLFTPRGGTEAIFFCETISMQSALEIIEFKTLER